MLRRSPCILVLLLLCAALPGMKSGLAAQQRPKSVRPPRDISVFRRQHAERREKFVAALEELAHECEAKELPEAAAEIRALAQPVDTRELRLAALPRHVQPELHADQSDDRQWRVQLGFQREKYAADVFRISRQAIGNGHVGYCYDLVRELIVHDPDHKVARQMLGYVRNGDEWVSAFEHRMRQEKKVWHDDFGWIVKDRVERYERGERMFNNKWISAEKEAEIRRDFAHAWEIPTEHYLIKTNHSMERGVKLARKLEDYHGVFFQLMAGFFNSPDQVQKLLAGSAAKPKELPRKNVIHYYRSRDEYLAAVRGLTGQAVEITRGIYFPRSGIAHFFFDPDVDDDSTLYHEATHQLLSGSRVIPGTRASRNYEIGVKSNFWIIEGIACYMESFRPEGNRFTVGDPLHQRLQAARSHFVAESYYVPFREFSRMGMMAFQNVPKTRLQKNYSQGAALTHFFMHYDDGRYREAMIEYLSQIYSTDPLVRDTPESLEDLTGIEAEQLDQQYAEYIRDLGAPAPRESAGVGQ